MLQVLRRGDAAFHIVSPDAGWRVRVDRLLRPTREEELAVDAALGLINIEQNGIIKFFSVVAVVFMPPTLIASIYGMNFRVMPELGWALGYPPPFSRWWSPPRFRSSGSSIAAGSEAGFRIA